MLLNCLRANSGLLTGLIFSLLPHAAPGQSASQAASQGQAADLAERALQQNLDQHLEWQRLLHYEPAGLWSPSVVRSQVADRRFFLAPDGATNPRQELLATLEGLQQPGPFSEDHPVCRFPARQRWLAQRLEWQPPSDPLTQCALYREWQEMVQAARATLVFPAYHLNSPSSMFGHTLLRLDPPATSGRTDWLGFSVSFGADVQAGDNSIFYAWKGVTGGYPGRFIVTPYFEKIKEYSRIENRDIWEYALNLSPSEVRRMVRHLWELKDMAFPYYFFDKNCSYRVLELLEIARPRIELTDDFGLTAIPIDTVRAAQNAGLIAEVDFLPSRASQLAVRLQALDPTELAWVHLLSQDSTVLDAPQFQAMPRATQAAVADASYEYLRYLSTRSGPDPQLALHSHRLLRFISRQPPPTPPQVAQPAPPEASHDSRRLALRGGQVAQQSFQELGLRMAFHDLEDSTTGFLPGAQINMASLDLRWTEDTLRLQTLDAVNILSLTPRDPFFSSWSWGVRAGLERPPFLPGRDLAGHVTGGAGGSWQVAPGWQSYALWMGRLDGLPERRDSLELSTGPRVGLLGSHRRLSAHLLATARAGTSGADIWETRSVVAWHLDRNQALRAEYRRGGIFEAQASGEWWLEYRHFFD